jgi:ParB family chromosome partitioning protein
MRADDQKERVVELPLEELHLFRNHPFHVRDDETMARTVESVKECTV